MRFDKQIEYFYKKLTRAKKDYNSFLKKNRQSLLLQENRTKVLGKCDDRRKISKSNEIKTVEVAIRNEL